MKSFDYTSFILKAYYASQTEKFQKNNFLNNGILLNGYLISGSLTKYRIIEFSRNADIFIQVKVSTGKIKLYGQLCEDVKKCVVDKNNFETLSIFIK